GGGGRVAKGRGNLRARCYVDEPDVAVRGERQSFAVRRERERVDAARPGRDSLALFAREWVEEVNGVIAAHDDQRLAVGREERAAQGRLEPAGVGLGLHADRAQLLAGRQVPQMDAPVGPGDGLVADEGPRAVMRQADDGEKLGVWGSRQP